MPHSRFEYEEIRRLIGRSHIHRSTLRYRLARVAELTGHDLRKVDTRFNLHAATRAWRFLNPTADPQPGAGV